MITVTDKAAKKIKTLLGAEGNAESGLRMGVTGGGCSGFQYELEFADSPGELDQVIESSAAAAAGRRRLSCWHRCSGPWENALWVFLLDGDPTLEQHLLESLLDLPLRLSQGAQWQYYAEAGAGVLLEAKRPPRLRPSFRHPGTSSIRRALQASSAYSSSPGSGSPEQPPNRRSSAKGMLVFVMVSQKFHPNPSAVASNQRAGLGPCPARP